MNNQAQEEDKEEKSSWIFNRAMPVKLKATICIRETD
jgi:hypothetical protein